MGKIPLGKFITLVGESALGAARPGLAYREISDLGGHAHLDIAAYWREDNENPAIKRFFKLINERYPEAVSLA